MTTHSLPQHTPWTLAGMPNCTGKIAIVTGANSGIGFETAFGLARKGAQVVLAVRNVEKGAAAAKRILDMYAAANVSVSQLNLASLASVRAFADTFCAKNSGLDILINNAGVMSPRFRTTQDGFELQFGTNHLGHFALTGLLLEPLLATRDARVVTVASAAHIKANINFDHLHDISGYHRWKSYGQSKLANLVFAYELSRRFETSGVDTMSVACHPGFAATNIPNAALGEKFAWLGAPVNGLVGLFAQSAEMGALPALYAATHPDIQGGEYIGPLGQGGMRGYPGIVPSTSLSHDRTFAHKLWESSVEATGVGYEALR